MISKKYLLAGGIASALLMGACSSVSADTNMDWKDDGNEGTAKVQTAEEVDMDKVEQNAQKAVDKAKENFEGKVTEVELDEDDGVYHYEIEMKNGKKDYEVNINAEDLSVLEEDFDSDDDLDDDVDDKFEYDDNGKTEQTKVYTDSQENKGLKSAEEAVNAAKERFDGEVEEVELDEDDGIYYYEIEMKNGKKEYEVDINAETLSILEEDFDREEDDDDRDDSEGRDGDDDRDDQESASSNNNQNDEVQPATKESKTQNKAKSSVISSKEAIQIAQNEVGGKVIEWDYDDEDAEYEVELNVSGEEREVEIDARTGNIIEIDD
ncbi:PepSY domain-containing protein [Salinicoccus sp. HZC-1]|uniref:PepSY domain-containing protein n=1 Tax=Salinicoccus sp. HZC-1 TaxID=3385497 RepID=UPI00398A5969